MNEHNNGHERRAGVLTQTDIDKIKEATCGCPHGMTAEDAFKLRDFLECWNRAKSAVGGYVIKFILVLIAAIGILVAWITNGGGKP